MLETEKHRVACLVNTSYAGSTMMTLLMNSHPQIAGVGEGINRRIFLNHIQSYACSCGEVLIECGFWKKVAQAINDQGVEFRIQDLSLGYKYQNKLLRRLLQTYCKYPTLGPLHAALTSHLPLHARRINKIGRVNVAFIRAVLELSRAQVFFNASKNLMGHYYLLRRPELDIKFIRIVRDVRSFVSSYKLKGQSVADAVKVWTNYQLRANCLIQSLPEQNVFLIRYEDLYQDPGVSWASICRFLDVDVCDPPGVFIPKEHHITGNKIRLQAQLTIHPIERWTTILSDEEMALTLDHAGHLNEQFGYRGNLC